jgi:hypothetical protein
LNQEIAEWWNTRDKQLEDKFEQCLTELNQIAKEKSQGFPWLANAYADYFYLREINSAGRLLFPPRRKWKEYERIKTLATKKREAEKLWRSLNYLVEYYENLFPWLMEFKGEELDDLIQQVIGEEGDHFIEDEDPVRVWLTQAEYRTLDCVQRNQLALDRYWQKKKSKWELGRDYERYIGYLWETQGWHVTYHGIVQGLADLGRDIIATKSNATRIIQCKHWSKYRVIHEKHVFQLFGTVVAFRLDRPEYEASGLLISSTRLSDRAKDFASILELEFKEDFPMQDYPCIKCNVSRKDGSRIYHLPMDQQYDRTLIEEERNECYVATVAEAEQMGFRRAYRWRGEERVPGTD